MIWWFVILAGSSAAVLWAGIAFYLRVRRHMKADAASKDTPGEVEHEQQAGNP